MFFKSKKSEIHRRAKNLLGAFSHEAKRQSFESMLKGQRKVIRAYYQKGLLVLKEDFIRPSTVSARINIQSQMIEDLIKMLKGELKRRKTNRS